MTTHSPQSRWSREQIGAARLLALAPLLQKRGWKLTELPAGNFGVTDYPGLLVK